MKMLITQTKPDQHNKTRLQRKLNDLRPDSFTPDLAGPAWRIGSLDFADLPDLLDFASHVNIAYIDKYEIEVQ